MANLAGLSFDENVKETGAFEVVPKGKYQVVITGDELMDNKAKTGKLLVLNLQIVSGEHKGVELIDRLNILHPTKKAQDIAQGTLKRLCSIHSVPFPPKDTRQLWGKPMTASVEVQGFESNTTGEMLKSNNVKGYSKAQKDISPVQESVPQAANKAVGNPWD